jgi:hypothetical protein
MKISSPKYGPGELLTRKQGATRIVSFVALAFFAGVCGSYLLANKLWLLTIAGLGIAGILLLLGARAAIFLNKNKVNEAPSAPIEENAPRRTPQWIIGRERQGEHAQLSTAQAQKRPMISVQILLG